MKRNYDKPKTFIHLQEPFLLLNSSLEGDDGIHVNMSGYQRGSSYLEDEDDEEDDGWK